MFRQGQTYLFLILSMKDACLSLLGWIVQFSDSIFWGWFVYYEAS